ncbi:hypothetical protein [Rufibacter quisquiliarum]|uniref:N-formylglutamate amidohydrolase n=1 Tax=Rufibacter quisquiliarum TaxID=1549639 RepID=A0A839GKA8_9BACT|nr:hypothetical protein [Rufibacter quisquiliarum]MBA9079292.1 N-formylglutamate amidohydrolase [Rufibacter quisquiliarum]
MKPNHLPGRRTYWVAAFSLVLWSLGCSKNITPEPKAVTSSWVANQSYYDGQKWSEMVVGTMPLVISVPHGGTVEPSNIPDRTCPDATTVRDANTIELARAIEQEFVKNYGVRPYLVISHIARKKIDQNREMEPGTCGNALMKETWQAYHNFVDTALALATRNHGTALFIDLHGHGHSVQRLELGYNLTASEVQDVSLNRNLATLAAKSSVNNLLQANNQITFRNMMVGDYGFGTLIRNEGFAAVPSKQDPYPLSNQPYFSGGYNTRTYTSANFPKVHGWQIECNMTGVRDTNGRPLFAAAFAKAIMQYYANNTSLRPPFTPLR